mgnify:FL=1
MPYQEMKQAISQASDVLTGSSLSDESVKVSLRTAE